MKALLCAVRDHQNIYLVPEKKIYLIFTRFEDIVNITAVPWAQPVYAPLVTLPDTQTDEELLKVIDLELVPSIKGYLIDPATKTVEPWAIEDWQDIAPAIDAETFDVVYLNENTIIYVDDEGLLKPENATFKLKDYPQPLAGKALVLCEGPDGETVDCPLTNEQVLELLE